MISFLAALFVHTDWGAACAVVIVLGITIVAAAIKPMLSILIFCIILFLAVETHIGWALCWGDKTKNQQEGKEPAGSLVPGRLALLPAPQVLM